MAELIYTWSFDDIVHDVNDVDNYERSCLMKASALRKTFFEGRAAIKAMNNLLYEYKKFWWCC